MSNLVLDAYLGVIKKNLEILLTQAKNKLYFIAHLKNKKI